MKVFIVQMVIALALVAGCARHRATVQTPAIGPNHGYPYNKPLFTPGSRFGSLPQVVQTTVLSEAGTAEIADVVRDISSGRVIYKIYFRDSNIYPPMYVGAEGSVLNPDLTLAVPGPRDASIPVKLADVPSDVLKALQARPHLPDVTSIIKEYWGDHVIYVISFKDEPRNPKLFIVSDGTVLVQSK